MSKEKKFKGAVPSHVLKVQDKVTGRSAVVGAGWLGRHGGVNIKLNMMTVLSYSDLEDCTLVLFPNDKGISYAGTIQDPPEDAITAKFKNPLTHPDDEDDDMYVK